MDVDNKLNTTNPMHVAEIFSKLVQNITVDKNTKQGFAYLKNKCLADNSFVSEVAGASILKLIENKVFQADHVLSDFLTSISTASNTNTLIKIVNKLLCFQHEQKTKISGKLCERTQILQHPFIKILQGDSSSDTQMCIYNEIIKSYKNSRASVVSEIHFTLYLYCLCNPTIRTELSLLRHMLWSFLVNNDECAQNNLLEICCWMQLQSKTKSELTGIFVHEALQKQLQHSNYEINVNQLILLEILITYNMILHNGDCHLTIETIIHSISTIKFLFHDLALLILSKAVLVCSPLYFECLLKLCLFILKQKSQMFSYNALKFSILTWISRPSLLTENALKIADEIIKINGHVSQPKSVNLSSGMVENTHFLTFCNPEIFLALHLGRKMECIQDTDKFHSFVKNIELTPLNFIKNCFTFLCGLLSSNKTYSESKTTILALVLKCSTYYIELSSSVLTVLLYLLSNTKDCKLLVEVLEALPQMAKVKENIPTVVATLQAVSNKSSDLKNLAMKLMYETWEIENKCYSHLETIMNNPKPKNILLREDRESNICKAFIFKKLAEKRPEIYGRDLVAHLSKLLNECSGSSGSLPSAIALEGIIHLCKAEIIDVVTTWATLAPKFKEDKRIPVIKSLCQLIKEIPHLDYTQSYDKLNEDVTAYLWHYVTNSSNEEVIYAALDALVSFNLELICAQMPEEFQDENFSKENTQRVVSGKTWMNLLTTCRSKKAAKHVLIKLVASEVDNYLKYVYQVKTQREPENLGSLPTHSIVRAFGEFLKSSASKVESWVETDKEVLYQDCLEILSLKYSKPLPPFDWCFLQQILPNPKLKKYCLDLVSHQVILSGSARRLVENYISGITDNPKPDDAMHIYRNLKYLANSIQPVIIKPFLDNSLHCAFNKIEVDSSSMVQMLDYLKEVLKDIDIQYVNKEIVEDVLRQLIFVTDVESKAFPLFLECIRYFSVKGLVKVTQFDPSEFDALEFRKVAKIRCYLAEQDNLKSSLNWLDGIFDIAFKNNVGIESFIDDLSHCLLNNVNREESSTWVMEYFGHIQAKVAERCDPAEVEYFCDVLTLSVVYFSGFFLLLPENDFASIKYFFPAAITFLLDDVTWRINANHVLEWLYHMNSAKSISEEYQKIFGWSLCCLRHQNEFSQTSKWMKYLDCYINTE